MSYYVKGSGVIIFARKLTDPEFEKAKNILCEVFEETSEFDAEQCCRDGKSRFVLGRYQNYDEEEILKALNLTAAIAPVEIGEIEFAGEEDDYWRFIFRNGVWACQNGEIVYDEDTFGKTSMDLEDIKKVLLEEGFFPNDNSVRHVYDICKDHDDAFVKMMHETGRRMLRLIIDKYVKNPETPEPAKTMTADVAIGRMNEPTEWMKGTVFACQINFLNRDNNGQEIEDETSFDIDCTKPDWRSELLACWEEFRKENNLPENCVTDAWSTLVDEDYEE